jgi:signal transduction histidine kinase
VLDDLGLLPALRSLAESVTRSGLDVTVRGTTAGRLPAPVETAVFRTAQEGLHNVLRHAHAAHAVIEVDRDAAELRWVIRDDGRGLDPPPDGRGGASGMGLDGMRERVARLGGTFDIRSRPGQGVTLAFRVPLEVSRAE